MKIRTKIILSMMITVMVIFLGYLVFLILKKDRDRLLIQSYQEQQEISINSAMRVNEEFLKNVVNDYSRWDEMVKYTLSRDSLWALSNISTAPRSYSLSGMWVLNRDAEVIYSYSMPEDPIQPWIFFTDSLLNYVTKQKLTVFFHKQSFRVYQCAAGTIHPSSDSLRSTPFAGYFFICRPIDHTALNFLEEMSGTEVMVLPSLASITPSSEPAETITLVPLTAWNERPVSFLEFRKEQPLLRSYFSITIWTGFYYVLFAVIIAIAIYFALFRWLSNPLKRITESLAYESPDPIRELAWEKNEFGQVSVMIQRFFEQKKDLAAIIREKNDALTSLADAESKNRTLLSAIPDHLFRINIFGVITDYHVMHPEELPVSLHFIRGKNYEEILPPHVTDQVKHAIIETNLTKTPKTIEFALPSSRGPTRYFETTLSLTSNGDYLAVLRNITERKEAEMALFRSLDKETELNRMKTHFISTISHEFRTPLSAITSNVQLLEMYGGKWPNEKKQTTLQRIQQAVMEMTNLIDDLSVIAKDETGKLKAQPAMFDLDKFCYDLVKDIPVRFEFAGVAEINYRREDNLACLDRDLLRHILINLLSNAMKFSVGGETVKLIVEDVEPSSVKFTVTDQGIGIPPADLASIFEPFHRGENATEIAGTGLGLSIVKRCVELMKGSITIESVPGKGTSVVVLLPAVNNQTGES